MFIGKF
jgi:hypothetical protein